MIFSKTATAFPYNLPKMFRPYGKIENNLRIYEVLLVKRPELL